MRRDRQWSQAEARPSQGHSKNPSCYGRDGFGAVLTKVFAGFRDMEAHGSDQAESTVAKGRERSCASADAASVLVEGHVADVVEPVLDGPMGAAECEQAFGPGLGGSERGDQIDDLDAHFIAGAPGALEACDLGRARPVEMGDDFGAGCDLAGLDAAVPFVGRRGGREIRRRTVEAPAPLRGGKGRRMPRQYWL